MNTSNSSPYGLKSLLECMSRATLLAQPDDVLKFLSTYVDEMTHFREKISGDTKEVAFRYEEQWEKNFFRKERSETLKTVPEDSPSPTSTVSSASSASFTVSPPLEVRRKTRRVSSVRVPRRQDSVGLTAEEIPTSTSQARPVPPPRGERVKTHGVSSVRVPIQKEKKPSLPSAWPVLPPIQQKAASQVSKQAQGQKSTKGRVSDVFTCRLIDCPYHIKPKEGSAVDRELGPVRMSTGPAVNRHLGLQKSEASSEIWVPYRPKGGPIVDPELAPKRTRAEPVKKRRTGAESNLLNSKKGSAYSRRGTNSTNLSQVSLESSTYTNLTHTVHIIKYSHMQVQCSELQPHSARLRNIALQPNLESQHQQVAKSSTPSDPTIRNSSAMGKSSYSYLSYWNQF